MKKVAEIQKLQAIARIKFTIVKSIKNFCFSTQIIRNVSTCEALSRHEYLQKLHILNGAEC